MSDSFDVGFSSTNEALLGKLNELLDVDRIITSYKPAMGCTKIKLIKDNAKIEFYVTDELVEDQNWDALQDSLADATKKLSLFKEDSQ